MSHNCEQRRSIGMDHAELFALKVSLTVDDDDAYSSLILVAINYLSAHTPIPLYVLSLRRRFLQ